MANILIRRLNGDEHTITLKALANRLADESRFGATLGELVQHGNTVAEIQFQDGLLGDTRETATLIFVPSPTADGYAAAASNQTELPIRHVNGHNRHVSTVEFEVEAMIMLRIPARIAHRSASPEWAAKLIREILAGEIDAPPGFLVDVDTDFIEAPPNLTESHQMAWLLLSCGVGLC